MIYYDFHIHSALSPCGDKDMTPNNIVNMAALSELDAIAVSDSAQANITMNVTLDTPYDIYIDGANYNVYVVEAGATPAI